MWLFFTLCVHVIFLLCIYVLISSCKYTSHIGSGPISMIWVYLKYSFKTLSPNIIRFWHTRGLDFNIWTLGGHSSAYNRWVTHKQAKGIKTVEHHKVEVKRVNEVRNSLMTKGLASQFCFTEAISSCRSFRIANLFPLAVFAVFFHRHIAHVNFFCVWSVHVCLLPNDKLCGLHNPIAWTSVWSPHWLGSWRCGWCEGCLATSNVWRSFVWRC